MDVLSFIWPCSCSAAVLQGGFPHGGPGVRRGFRDFARAPLVVIVEIRAPLRTGEVTAIVNVIALLGHGRRGIGDAAARRPAFVLRLTGLGEKLFPLVRPRIEDLLAALLHAPFVVVVEIRPPLRVGRRHGAAGPLPSLLVLRDGRLGIKPAVRRPDVVPHWFQVTVDPRVNGKRRAVRALAGREVIPRRNPGDTPVRIQSRAPGVSLTGINDGIGEPDRQGTCLCDLQCGHPLAFRPLRAACARLSEANQGQLVALAGLDSRGRQADVPDLGHFINGPVEFYDGIVIKIPAFFAELGMDVDRSPDVDVRPGFGFVHRCPGIIHWVDIMEGKPYPAQTVGNLADGRTCAITYTVGGCQYGPLIYEKRRAMVRSGARTDGRDRPNGFQLAHGNISAGGQWV